MLSVRLFLLFITITFSGCIVFPTYTSHISLNAIKVNAQEVHIHNALLIGTGPVASKVFLENLSGVMIQDFRFKGVRSEFSFIGKVPQYAPLNMDSLVNAKFDTYIVFRASDGNYLNMSKQKYRAYSYGVTATGYGNQYLETYKVMLYNKKENNLQMVWQGDLHVDFDLAQDYRYIQISKQIIDEFVKNRILPH